MYYKGQAISQLACVYAERGDNDAAQKWASKSVSIFNSREVIDVSIDKGDDLLCDVAFCTYWFSEELFYMAVRIDNDDSIKQGDKYKQACFETVAKVFETVYRNDDMGYEQFQHLYNLHQGIAEYEATNRKNEGIIRYHLERAAECCEKSIHVKKHTLANPMLYGWNVADAPCDNRMNLRFMQEKLSTAAYDEYRNSEWLKKLESKVSELITK